MTPQLKNQNYGIQALPQMSEGVKPRFFGEKIQDNVVRYTEKMHGVISERKRVVKASSNALDAIATV